MHHVAKLFIGMLVLVVLSAGIPINGYAYTGDLRIPAEGETQMITLEDGSTLVGRITEIRADQVKFLTDLGEMIIAVAKIKSISTVTEKKEVPAVQEPERPAELAVTHPHNWFPNPNRTRLLIGPTARTLSAGDGYFYDLWIFFPGLAYGITNNFMISGGASVIPGADDQMFYVMPKVGFPAAEQLDLALSVVAFRLWEETFYFALGGMTYGTDDASVTGALGLAFTDEKMAEKPAAMLGGEYRFSRRAGLVGESWFVPGDLEDGMLGMLAMRLLGEKMTIDVGVGISYEDNSGEVEFDGSPTPSETDWLPYVDFVWNF